MKKCFPIQTFTFKILVINFDIIHRLARGENIPNEIYKNLQTIHEDEIKKYPINNQKEILGSIFRSERKDILFNKKNLEIHFKDQKVLWQKEN